MSVALAEDVAAPVMDSAVPVAQEAVVDPLPLTMNDLIGEKVTYDIKEGPLKVGEAELVFEGPVDYDDGEALLLRVNWKVFGISSDEKIYVNPDTFYPIFISKDRSKFGCKMSIIEDYFPEEGKVSIERDGCREDSQEVIDRGVPTDNLYAAVYRLRLQPDFRSEESVDLHLLREDVNVRLEGMVKIDISRQEYDAYHFSGEKLSFWLNDTVDRVPLKIESSLDDRHVVMVLNDHEIETAEVAGHFFNKDTVKQ